MKTLGSRWFLVCWFLVFGGVRIPGLMGHLAARVYSFETGGEAVFRLCLVRETVLETLLFAFRFGLPIFLLASNSSERGGRILLFSPFWTDGWRFGLKG
jgi:hypothetical protein